MLIVTLDQCKISYHFERHSDPVPIYPPGAANELVVTANLTLNVRPPFSLPTQRATFIIAWQSIGMFGRPLSLYADSESWDMLHIIQPLLRDIREHTKRRPDLEEIETMLKAQGLSPAPPG